jgi:hypothetical protein
MGIYIHLFPTKGEPYEEEDTLRSVVWGRKVEGVEEWLKPGGAPQLRINRTQQEYIFDS